MIKKILQYLAFYLDNLVNNLFPSKNQYKRWKEVDEFRQQAYIRVAAYLYAYGVITTCYFEGWIGLVLIPAIFAAYGVYYFLTKWLIRRKRNNEK